MTDPNDRLFNLTSRDDFTLQYDGLLVSLRKRWSRGWQALASYTWSEATGLLSSNWNPPDGDQTGRVTGLHDKWR